jgi:hypothetical protein
MIRQTPTIKRPKRRCLGQRRTAPAVSLKTSFSGSSPRRPARRRRGPRVGRGNEERAHARLLKAMEKRNVFQVQAFQDFWLKCSETLRKLDLAVEMARRDAEEQVTKKLAEEISLFISEWLRVAFTQFLSSEGPTLMGIKRDWGMESLCGRTVQRDSRFDGQKLTANQIANS